MGGALLYVTPVSDQVVSATEDSSTGTDPVVWLNTRSVASAGGAVRPVTLNLR